MGGNASGIINSIVMDDLTKTYTNPEQSFTIVFSWEAPDPNHEKFNEHPHWIDFVVYEITGRMPDGSPAYTNDYKPEIDPDDPLCHGYIKWDGCMEIHDFGGHFCGWSRVMEYLMRDIYLQAATIMDEWDLEEHGNLNELKKYYNILDNEE